MSGSKHIEKICWIILAITVVITVLFMNGEKLGIVAEARALGYETRLFDQSVVHTIDIIMDEDDWGEFIDNAASEEYVSCTVLIDNEAYKNVAIRAKGNTSLSQVSNYDNDRYSFKIEFDHYDSSNTYYGLDKLSLNNIIQDNTYVKDYLVYTMMNVFGVNAPLTSFVEISVNGEEWGLYLAVEGVEDAFLQRNYGNENGNLYKPDSQTMGGGRGNGKDFDFDEWNNRDSSQEEETKTASSSDTENTENTDANSADSADPRQQPQDMQGQGQMPEMGEMPADMQPGGSNLSVEQIQQLWSSLSDDQKQTLADALGYVSTEDLDSAVSSASSIDDILNGTSEADLMQTLQDSGFMQDMMQDFGEGMGGGGNDQVMTSSDVSLIYTDDDIGSYENIFSSAKTDIDETDEKRLIASLKDLNNNENIEDVVDVDQVIRYFVVHNFVDNFDSYTGSMIHNYYLYEEDGQLAMIPWDYNLAFGGFVGGSDATTMVNYPIDTPVSGGTVDSRPMLAWIFNNEEYTELYHEYFQEFIDQYFTSGYFDEMMASLKSLISSYIENDPTAFCTYEEWETGFDTLVEFCDLRAQSVQGQLDGTIPSTSDGQSEDSSSLIDASSISINAMGEMNIGGMGGGQGDDKQPGGDMGGGQGGGMAKPDDSQMYNPADSSTNTRDAAAETADASTVEDTEADSSAYQADNPDMAMPDQQGEGMMDPGQNMPGGMPGDMPGATAMADPGSTDTAGNSDTEAQGQTIAMAAPGRDMQNMNPGGPGQSADAGQAAADVSTESSRESNTDSAETGSDTSDAGGASDSSGTSDSQPDQNQGFGPGQNMNAGQPGDMNGSMNQQDPGEPGDPGDMQNQEETSSVDPAQAYLLMGVSLVVLIAGLLVAKFYPHKV